MKDEQAAKPLQAPCLRIGTSWIWGLSNTDYRYVPMLNGAYQRVCYRARLSKFGKASLSRKSRCFGTHFLPAFVTTLSICHPGTTKNNTELSSSKAAVLTRLSSGQVTKQQQCVLCTGLRFCLTVPISISAHRRLCDCPRSGCESCADGSPEREHRRVGALSAVRHGEQMLLWQPVPPASIATA